MQDEITLTADVIIEWADGSIVLTRRKTEPFRHYWGLPGGKMEGSETIEETAIRESKEETGLDITLERVIGVYSRPGRDPRGRFVSVTFLAHPVSGMLIADSDAEDLTLIRDLPVQELAFDHRQILNDYREFLDHWQKK